MSKTIARTALALACCAAILAPGRASADIGKCESKLIKATSKLSINLSKSLAKCSSLARKAIDGSGAVDAKSADGCEKNLMKVLNIGGEAGGGVVGKTLASIASLHPDTCTDDDLSNLGHLVSGINAPGTDATDFLASVLILRELDIATAEAFAAIGDLQNTLSQFVAITDCGTQRPNLCSFAAAQNPDCRVHACTLSSAGAFNLSAGVPGSLNNRVSTLEFCQAPASLLSLPVDLSSDYRALFTETARSLAPAPNLSGINVTVCIDQLRGEGWCDCAGNGVPTNVSLCRDRNANDNGGTCSGSGAFCLTSEDCASGQTCSAGASDDCGGSLAEAEANDANCGCTNGVSCRDDSCNASEYCLDGEGLGGCQTGTRVGPLVETWSGSSTAGACVVQQTISFKFVPAGICVDGSANTLGVCNTVCAGPGNCAADAACSSLGGTACQPTRGADLTACTADDVALPSAPTNIVLTTGTSQTTIRDMVTAGAEGLCNNNSLNNGTNCISNQDCSGAKCNGGGNNGAFCSVSTDCPGGTCQAGACQGLVSTGGVVPGTNQITLGPGTALTCGAYDSSSLSNFKLVGTLPLLNFMETGDTIASLTLDCD